MAASGSNPNSEKDLPSISPSPSDPASARRPQILVVEDSKADLFLIREAISAACIDATLHVVRDGTQAIGFIDAADQAPDAVCPDLVLLDLNLPKKNGAEVLLHMRNSGACRNIRVLIVSSSDSANDRGAVEALGTNGYFRKPSAYAEYLKLGHLVRDLLAGSDCAG